MEMQCIEDVDIPEFNVEDGYFEDFGSNHLFKVFVPCDKDVYFQRDEEKSAKYDSLLMNIYRRYFQNNEKFLAGYKDMKNKLKADKAQYYSAYEYFINVVCIYKDRRDDPAYKNLGGVPTVMEQYNVAQYELSVVDNEVTAVPKIKTVWIPVQLIEWTVATLLSAGKYTPTDQDIRSIFVRKTMYNLSAIEWTNAYQYATEIVKRRCFTKYIESMLEQAKTEVLKRNLDNISKHINIRQDVYYNSKPGTIDNGLVPAIHRNIQDPSPVRKVVNKIAKVMIDFTKLLTNDFQGLDLDFFFKSQFNNMLAVFKRNNKVFRQFVLLFQNLYIYCDKMLRNIKTKKEQVFEYKDVKVNGYLAKVQLYLHGLLQKSVIIKNYNNLQSVNSIKRILVKIKTSISDMIDRLQSSIVIDWKQAGEWYKKAYDAGFKLSELTCSQFTNLMKNLHKNTQELQVNIIENNNDDPKTIMSYVKQMEEFVYNSRDMYCYLQLDDLYENTNELLKQYTDFVLENPEDLQDRCDRIKCIYCYCLDNKYENAFINSDVDEDF